MDGITKLLIVLFACACTIAVLVWLLYKQREENSEVKRRHEAVANLALAQRIEHQEIIKRTLSQCCDGKTFFLESHHEYGDRLVDKDYPTRFIVWRHTTMHPLTMVEFILHWKKLEGEPNASKADTFSLLLYHEPYLEKTATFFILDALRNAVQAIAPDRMEEIIGKYKSPFPLRFLQNPPREFQSIQ